MFGSGVGTGFHEYTDGNATDPIGPKEGRGRSFEVVPLPCLKRWYEFLNECAERPHNRMNGLGFVSLGT